MWTHPKDFTFLLVDEPDFKEKWDYQQWKIGSTVGFYGQKDWNQTLHTKFNIVNAHIHKSSLKGGANNIRLHPIFSPLIKSLEYSRMDENSEYVTKFKVTYDETLPIDKIYLYADFIFDFFLVPKVVYGDKIFIDDLTTETEIMDLEIQLITDLSDDEIEVYKDKLWGYIEIENYESN